ncbi:class I SAM-dependent methyltransferase [Streptococcus dentiloxodontae]
MNTIVTTCLKQNLAVVAYAKSIAEQYQLPYVERRKQSLRRLMRQNDSDGVLIVHANELVYKNKNESQLRFHPDTAVLRIKASHDPLVELLGAGSKSILDTTMGLASDSLVMAAAGHKVTALESQLLIYLIVSQGLAAYSSGNAELDAAMRTVKTYCQDSLDYLKQQPSRSVDIIYCDPMFSEEIAESANLSGLKPLANRSSISEDWLKEAKRVASEAIIIKAHFRDTIFEDLGFKRYIRPNQKFHYGKLLL